MHMLAHAQRVTALCEGNLRSDLDTLSQDGLQDGLARQLHFFDGRNVGGYLVMGDSNPSSNAHLSSPLLSND
jgi:hypothetical protein